MVYYMKLLLMWRSKDYLETCRQSSGVSGIHTLMETLDAAQVFRSLITVFQSLPLVHSGTAVHCPPQARPVMVQSLRTHRCFGRVGSIQRTVTKYMGGTSQDVKRQKNGFFCSIFWIFLTIYTFFALMTITMCLTSRVQSYYVML